MTPNLLQDKEQTAPPKKKILWVEDDSFLTNIIAQELSKQQWTIIYAADGATALPLARTEQPDAIVLDILLPGIDGIEVLTQLKGSDETKRIPVIMFTNLDDQEKIDRSIALGAAGFFIKATVTLEAITAEIQKAISHGPL
jgi:DNA-binding response OmpR family regulator